MGQSLTWYARRLQSMSPREVTWRLRSAMRDAADRYLLALRRQPRPRHAMLREGAAVDIPGYRVTDLTTGEWANVVSGQLEHVWCQDLLAKADAIAAHRLSFFDLEDHYLGSPIDWNCDHKTGKHAPMRYAPRIDYRDVGVTGDSKHVWEPNRHHQFVVLARAYRATGDVLYAEALVEQLASWLDRCPYGLGMNWRSPLELGIRLINWVWALSLIRPAGVVHGELRSRILHAVCLHIWDISRKYSQGSSANNHLIGEAAGTYIASSYFRELKDAQRWRSESHEILREQIIEQTYPDGGSREQALGYHVFVAQLFLLAGIVSEKTEDAFPQEYWSRLEKMFEFAGAMTEGGQPPAFGDADDGYVLDLGGNPRSIRSLMAVGAVVFDRPEFKAWAGGYSEPARWLLRPADQQRFDAIRTDDVNPRIGCRAFPDSGYYLLQTGRAGADDRISVGFDCGELGFRSIAAHGHADALSLTLRAFGVDVLIDPGTYDYFSYPAWRDYFRSTRAHNTVVIDGHDQSEMQGPFLWGKRAAARCLSWEPCATGGKVVAEHDGYARLTNPARHRRTVELDGVAREVVVRDDILAEGQHDVEVCFHLGENCRIEALGSNRFEIDAGPGLVTLEMDRRLHVETLRGSEKPICGWVSRGYHRKVPTTTLLGRCSCEGDMSLACRIVIGSLTGDGQQDVSDASR